MSGHGVEGDAARAWIEFNHNTPEAFWDVAVWREGGWVGGSLDVADRKRIGLALLGFAPQPEASGHRLVLRMEAPICECGLQLGGHEGTAMDWHAQHLAERVTPPRKATS